MEVVPDIHSQQKFQPVYLNLNTQFIYFDKINSIP